MSDEDTSQVPAPAPEQATSPQEAATTAVEAEATQTEPETQTAQVPANEPLPIESAPSAPAATSASATPAPVVTHPARDLLVKARATIQDRKAKKLDKILEFLNTKGKVTNDEVEKLLHVSDATATRYLSVLEKQGKIKQVGRTGKAVEYTRI